MLSCILCAVEDEVPEMKYLQRWSKDSLLCIDWYNFAVDLIGKNKTEIIKAKYSGGGNHACLERLLSTWWNSTIDHSWQVIVNALKHIDETTVIENIEDKFLNKK